MMLILIIGFVSSYLFVPQLCAQGEVSFDTGIKEYNEANKWKKNGEERLERDRLSKAYDVFNSLVSDSDDRAVIMGFTIFLRLRSFQLPQISSFSQPGDINKYVRKEYGEKYPTIETMTIFSSNEITKTDKKLLVEELNKIAGDCIKKAKDLNDEARQYTLNFEYDKAVDKLKESLKNWDLPETAELLENTNELLTKCIELRADYNAYINQRMFPEVFKLLEIARGILPADEITSLKKEAEKVQSIDVAENAEKSYESAFKLFDMRKLEQALIYIDDSIASIPQEKAVNLRKEIKKRLKKVAFFLDFGTPGAIKPGDMNYSSGNSFQHGHTLDRNAIVSSGFKKSISVGGGFLYLFSRTKGIIFSVSSIKHKWNFNTDYEFSCTFSNGANRSAQNTLSDNAESSIIPISVDFISVSPLFKDLNFFLQAGPSIYLADVNLYARIGSGAIWPFPNAIYDECFPFQYSIIKSGIGGIGGNIGGGLEYRLPPVGLFVKFEYYLFPSKKYDWKLIDQSYQGLNWGLPLGSPSGLYLPEYEMKINFSTFKFNVGVRYYF